MRGKYFSRDLLSDLQLMGRVVSSGKFSNVESINDFGKQFLFSVGGKD